MQVFSCMVYFHMAWLSSDPFNNRGMEAGIQLQPFMSCHAVLDIFVIIESIPIAVFCSIVLRSLLLCATGI